jgi:hypothetical protein
MMPRQRSGSHDGYICLFVVLAPQALPPLVASVPTRIRGRWLCGGEICQYLRMQIIEASVVGVRSAVITFLRPDTPMQIVLFPMLHLGTTGFCKAVAGRLRDCQLVVAEGIQGRSATASLLTMSYRLLGRSRRLGLVVQDLHLDSLGSPVIRPDMTGKELGSAWRQGVGLLHRLLIIAAVPVFAAGMLLFGTRRVLGRYLALDDLPTREQELAEAAFEDIDKVIVADRDVLVIDALTSIHQQRSAEPISVAVVYGAGHMPAIAAMLVSRLGYHARSAEWLTVFDYS